MFHFQVNFKGMSIQSLSTETESRLPTLSMCLQEQVCVCEGGTDSDGQGEAWISSVRKQACVEYF